MNADAITGQKVRDIMRERRISQEALASVLASTQKSVSRKLSGDRSWMLDELLAVAAFFEVAVTDLLPGAGYEPVPAGRGRVGATTDQKVRGSSPFGRTLC
ncbi:Transcriptional regulator, contains XRE-family HTH domain [Microbacterium testaceum StLB037]|uniref:Transcriptional regulator, contains XRE-family HTH domain n=1 Tax=Microbacterium testaceum (strain StLB037) TaxID=979556 RepID=A0A1H0PPS9_MICTS|nr:helix-turn-helix transcriptional regulator [Microbacterium testaceum]SDP07004.1 Transcriptional regulator, contains XRE-family HTH domain [Microbacterium testaceum StLB037]